MGKTTIKIDSQILEPWLNIAGILGMTLSEYLNGYLRQLGDTMREGGLRRIGEEISDWPYETRESAQAVVDRFEEFAIDEKLAGESDVGTVAAEAVPTDDGNWTVKAHYLSPAGKRWNSVSVIDDWNDKNDSDGE